MEKNRKKLSLNRESVLNLTVNDLGDVVGGMKTKPTDEPKPTERLPCLPPSHLGPSCSPSHCVSCGCP